MLNKKRIWVLLVYAALLAASFVVRMTSQPASPSSGKRFVDLRIDESRSVRFAYKQSGVAAPDQVPVIVVHGSPGNSGAFDGLVNSLPGREIISVDLPGFGDSDHDIPDYSILAHARYLQQFLTSKKIEKAHFVGFSLGGGVVLHVADLNPELIQSITLISSVGTQEYELFGDYHVNHIVHGLQLVFAWMLRELTPHFGLFDGGMIEYSRNFFDSDQRPLRSILQGVEKPFLILHGTDDPLVPVEAAREHARIVPQSEYQELNDGHFFLFLRPESISGILSEFWKRVDGENGKFRKDAAKARIDAARIPFDYEVIPAKGPVAICVFLLILSVAFINEDFAALITGVFIAQGRIGPLIPGIAIIVAIVLGSFILRGVGRQRRGKARGFLPSVFNSPRSVLFGFRFYDYIDRSRDAFAEYSYRSISTGIFRTSVIVLAAFLLARGFVFIGLAENSDTLVLTAVSLFTYFSISVLRLRLSRRTRRRF